MRLRNIGLRKISFKYVFVYMLSLLFLCGCKRNIRNITNNNDNYEVAIIETTGNENKSRISFYNDKLEYLSQVSLPYGTLGNIFYNPITLDNKLYIIPQGLANKKDTKKVLELNMIDNNINEFSINQLAMNSLAVNNTYIYTCNTTNGISYINQLVINNNDVNTLEITDVYISKLMLNNDILYAFGTKKEESGLVSYLYIIDSVLSIRKTIDISASGTSQYKALFIDNYLYFSNLMDREDKPGKIVGKLNLIDNNIENIELDYEYPSDLVQYNDYLLIAHCNLMSNEGNVLSFYNIKNENIDIAKLDHPITQMNIKGDVLYIIDGSHLYQYSLNQEDISNLSLLKEIDILQNENSKDYFYVSGFYLR